MSDSISFPEVGQGYEHVPGRPQLSALGHLLEEAVHALPGLAPSPVLLLPTAQPEAAEL